MATQLEWTEIGICFAGRYAKGSWYSDYFWEAQYKVAYSNLFQSHFES